MKPAPFDYAAATSLDEAVALLADHGRDARVLAGGQSLVPMMNLRMARPSVLIDINGVESLMGWRVDDGRVHLGAATRQRVLEHDARLGIYAPLLARAVRHIGHVATRNRGTIGGSLAHADPSAELPVCALVLDARMHARSKRGARNLEASEFFTGIFTTALAEDEVMESVSFVPSASGTGFAFDEVSRRPGDFAMVAAACAVSLSADGHIQRARLALGGVGPTATRIADAERLLVGQAPSVELWRAAADAVSKGIDPGSDLHATAQYRREVAAVLTRRVLESATGQAVEGRP